MLLFGVQAQSTKTQVRQRAEGSQSAQAQIETLPVEAFAKRIASKGVVLVDVRSAKEFADGHLKGATNIVWGDDFERQWNAVGIGKQTTVALYCRGGRRSKAAAEALAKMGYKVVNLDGGIMAWRKAGKPVAK
ncbi:MAG: rhodanese-like domain-containing protein [Bacteroidales bacterium]|nr:rhodanese-like domain-containing protein [Bacteroidales bacterium]